MRWRGCAQAPESPSTMLRLTAAAQPVPALGMPPACRPASTPLPMRVAPGEALLPPPRLDQRIDAAHPVRVPPIRKPRVDPRDDRIAPRLGRIEVRVEHTGGAGELQLARRPLADVEVRLAELRSEIGGGTADHGLEPLRAVMDFGGRGRRLDAAH